MFPRSFRGFHFVFLYGAFAPLRSRTPHHEAPLFPNYSRKYPISMRTQRRTTEKNNLRRENLKKNLFSQIQSIGWSWRIFRVSFVWSQSTLEDIWAEGLLIYPDGVFGN